MKDFEFYDVPRPNRTGDGVGVLLRKGFTVKRKACPLFTSMELLDLEISYGPSLIRLITVYRPPRSKKNTSTQSDFLMDFSTLLKTLTLVPGYLLLNGDFNLHMDVQTNVFANSFKDLLESAGLTQRIIGPTHCNGHTLDLIIDRHEDTKLSSFSIVTDLPSDHYAVFCSIAFAKPPAQKSQFKQRRLRNMNIDAFKSDIANISISKKHNDSDPNDLAELYNSELRHVLDKHAPEVHRSITLRPHAPWFTAELRDAKREKRRCERAYRASGLEVHKQIYREQ